MSKAEILAELPRLSHQDRRAIMGYLLELEQDAELLADHNRNADECFLMLDALEAEDEQVQAR
ncbi:hypothetical protein [Methylomagnum sp.]